MRKRSIIAAILCTCLCFWGCSEQENSRVLLERSFFEETWERFDYVKNTIQIEEETTYDLSMKISFTDDYPYDDFSMVFTVFDAADSPYRSKGYKFNLKESDGQWKAPSANGTHTFEFPINKALTITDAGTYTFQIEYRMPYTPITGVKHLSLIRN